MAPRVRSGRRTPFQHALRFQDFSRDAVFERHGVDGNGLELRSNGMPGVHVGERVGRNLSHALAVHLDVPDAVPFGGRHGVRLESPGIDQHVPAGGNRTARGRRSRDRVGNVDVEIPSHFQGGRAVRRLLAGDVMRAAAFHVELRELLHFRAGPVVRADEGHLHAVVVDGLGACPLHDGAVGRPQRGRNGHVDASVRIGRGRKLVLRVLIMVAPLVTVHRHPLPGGRRRPCRQRGALRRNRQAHRIVGQVVRPCRERRRQRAQRGHKGGGHGRKPPWNAPCSGKASRLGPDSPGFSSGFDAGDGSCPGPFPGIASDDDLISGGSDSSFVPSFRHRHRFLPSPQLSGCLHPPCKQPRRRQGPQREEAARRRRCEAAELPPVRAVALARL